MLFFTLFLFSLIPNSSEIAGIGDVQILSIDKIISMVYDLTKDVLTLSSELFDMLVLPHKFNIGILNEMDENPLVMHSFYRPGHERFDVESGGVSPQFFGDAFPKNLGYGFIRPRRKSSHSFEGLMGLGVVLVYKISGTNDYLHILGEIRDSPNVYIPGMNDIDNPRQLLSDIFSYPYRVFESLMKKVLGSREITSILVDVFDQVMQTSIDDVLNPIDIDVDDIQKIIDTFDDISSLEDIKRTVYYVAEDLSDIIKNLGLSVGNLGGQAADDFWGGLASTGGSVASAFGFDDDDIVEPDEEEDDDDIGLEDNNGEVYGDDIERYKKFETVVMGLLDMILTDKEDAKNIIHSVRNFGTVTLSYGIFGDTEDHTEDLNCVVKGGEVNDVPDNVIRPVCTYPGNPQFDEWGMDDSKINQYGFQANFMIDKPLMIVPKTDVQLKLTIYDVASFPDIEPSSTIVVNEKEDDEDPIPFSRNVGFKKVVVNEEEFIGRTLSNYPGEDNPMMTLTVNNGLVTLEGMIYSKSKNYHLGTSFYILPEEFRPAGGNMHFNARSSSGNALVRIIDGQIDIYQETGSKDRVLEGWVSLNGISYDIKEPVIGIGVSEFLSGFSSYGYGNPEASYMVKDGVVHLEGLLTVLPAPTSAAPIFKLPFSYRPGHAIHTIIPTIFGTAMVRIFPDGLVDLYNVDNYVDDFDPVQMLTWASLDGLRFIRKEQESLFQTAEFQNGYRNYDSSNAQAGFVEIKNIVYLEGLIVGPYTHESTIFTLPVGYRPKSRLHFSIQTGSGTNEVHVNRDGSVVLMNENNASRGWISLNSVFFNV